MKSKKIMIVIIISIVLVATAICIFLVTQKNNNEERKNEIEQCIVNKVLDEKNEESKTNTDANIVNEENKIEENSADKNQIEYQNSTTIENLKQETGATGDSDLYEMRVESDGRKVLTIKSSITYQVALAGMLKQEKPTKQELTSIISDGPTKNGIWIEKSSRNKFLELLKGNTESTYKINENGYLKLEKQNNPNQNDKILQKLIKQDKQYCIQIKESSYIVDEITGEIQENPFEQIDPYQTYEYVQYNGNYVISLNSNKQGLLKNNEIMQSLLELLK